MQSLRDSDVREYCREGADDRNSFISGLIAQEALRPLLHLPVFELCRAIYFGAWQGRLDLSQFRACWNHLAGELEAGCTEGFLLHLDSADTNELLQGLVLEEAQLPSPPPRRDRRDRDDDYTVQTERLRRVLPVPEDDGVLQWRAISPAPLTLPLPCAVNGQDVVLDTNNLVELLNVLPDENLAAISPRLAPRAIRMFKESLRTGGRSGRLIVPLWVIVETDTLLRKSGKSEEYANAIRMLEDWAYQSESGLWTAFTIEPFSTEVLNHLLGLLEELLAAGVACAQWPKFGDALVLAQGLYAGAPIASTEWHEKTDWDVVASLHAFLRL